MKSLLKTQRERALESFALRQQTGVLTRFLAGPGSRAGPGWIARS